jgi:DNA processing protein
VFLRERVGLESGRFEMLVVKLGGPEVIWTARPEALLNTGIFSDEQLGRLLKGRDQREEFEGALTRLMDFGLKVVSCFDADFPGEILKLSHPPSYLYRKGTDAASGPHLLVAGATDALAANITQAVEVGKALASLNIVLVSNLTEGLETAAHVGALSGAGGHRVFLPCGHECAAAGDSAPVLAQVAQAGAVYSEYAPETRPSAARRADACRLALGAAQGVLVLGRVDAHISAAVTAATVAGRPVFYLTGGDSGESEVLVREGAYPVPAPEQLERILPLL